MKLKKFIQGQLVDDLLAWGAKTNLVENGGLLYLYISFSLVGYRPF